MTVNRLSVGFNLPAAIHDDGHTHNLPPYAGRRAFLVDEYEACPDNWLRSSGRTMSYFVPVKAGHGMWLDFNRCLNDVAQHVAVVVSAQGINAVTGLPCKDATLEQYLDKCPRHLDEFGPERLCKKCGYKFPKQCYLATTGTPEGSFWLDGFRTKDGTVRQYIFTEEEMRGVAANIIGKDRVFALGISFFLGKETRPQPVIHRRQLMDSGPKLSFCPGNDDQPIGSSSINSFYAASTLDSVSDESITYGCSLTKSMSDVGAKGSKGPQGVAGLPGESRMLGSYKVTRGAPRAKMSVKQMEIAAGAKINQHVYDDPMKLDYWQDEPEGLIVINYCSEEEAQKIIEAGKTDLSGNQEGFLKDIPVGN